MSRRAGRPLLVILTGLMALGVIGTAPAAAADPADRQGYIVFAGSSGSGGGPTAIYAVTPGNSRPQRLMSHPTQQLLHPIYSPDGKWIAYVRLAPGPVYRLMIMRASGAMPRDVTTMPIVGPPAWSPDGSQLAFSADLFPAKPQLHIISVDGTGLRSLGTAAPGGASLPVWGANGRIYYNHHPGDDEEEIWAIDPDGTNNELVVDAKPTGLAVSPDGTMLAYGRRSVDFATIQLVVRDLTDGTEQQITDSTGANVPSSFSPDSRRLLFLSTRNSDIASFYTIDPDGSNEEYMWVNMSRVYGGSWGPRVFLDMVGSPFAGDVSWAVDRGLVAGCGIAAFCPDRTVTRGEMASFLVRAFNLPASDENRFDDHWHSVHANALEALAEARIMAGCGERRACPDAPVTREQAAAFLARALDLPRPDVDYFSDDETSIFEGDINRLAAAGITAGCGDGRFCPKVALSRGQVVALLHRALE